MTKRAVIRTGDLNRLLKAAKERGFAVELHGDVVRLLPIEGGAAVPSASNQADEDWDKALGLK